MSRPITARAIVDREVLRLDDRALLAERRAGYARQDNPTDQDRIAAAMEKSRPVYEELETSPPNPLVGEDSRSFRLRQLGELKRHHERYADVGLRAMAGLGQAAFDGIEAEIVDAARVAARSWAPEGTLRERKVRKDVGGPLISEFVGDPLACWGTFMRPGVVVRNFVYPNSNGVPIEHRRITVPK
jgi:hypothetical protein